MMRKMMLGVQAGLLGGCFVGLAEATWLLSSAGSVSDYAALVYAAILYAGIGLGQGIGLGIGLVVLSKIWKGLTDERAWSLAFLGAFCSLGAVITLFLANKVVYAEQGVPMTGKLAIAGLYGADFVIGMWLLPILLTKTPLRILMEPKGTFAAWGGLIVATGLFSLLPAGADDKASRVGRDQADLGAAPNVILIMSDTLRHDYIGPYDPSRNTPALDALAQDGVVFERAHANASWTRASFASVYTSMVPSSHNTALKSSLLPSDVETVAEVLAERGYANGGLPNNTNVTATFGFGQGFDHYPYMAPNLPFFATESVYQLSMYSVLRKVGEKLQGESKEVTDFYQPAPTVFEHARDFISAQQGDRFFLMVHLMEAHDPYFERPYNGVAYGRAEHEVPEADKVDYLKETYATEIEHMDSDIGAFMDWLKAEGLYDDTVIVFTADHGEEFLEHGGWWHGTTLYQEQIHVPMIVKLADQEHAGTRAPWVVRHIDIAPTLADAAGAEPSPSWQGESMLNADFDAFVTPAPEPAVLDEAPEDGAGEAPEVAPVVQVDPRTYDRLVFAEEDFEGNVVTALRRGDWKLIKSNDGPRGLAPVELYDLAFDAGEQKNATAEDPATTAQLDDEMRKQIMAATGNAVAGEETEMDEATKERLRALGYMD
jgi:arylsulfatase A-like enzyme